MNNKTLPAITGLALAHPASPLAATDNEPTRPINREVFIRRCFLDDPKKGCELMFKLFYQPLCNHAVRYVYSIQIAEDIVAEIFYIFWQKKLHECITISFEAYLFMAVRNRCLKHLRKEFGNIDRTEDNNLDMASVISTPHQILEFNELNHLINQTIQRLSPQCQKVFIMSRFEGKKYQEIAQELNLSQKTIEAQISKALNILRKLFRNKIPT